MRSDTWHLLIYRRGVDRVERQGDFNELFFYIVQSRVSFESNKKLPCRTADTGACKCLTNLFERQVVYLFSAAPYLCDQLGIFNGVRLKAQEQKNTGGEEAAGAQFDKQAALLKYLLIEPVVADCPARGAQQDAD